MKHVFYFILCLMAGNTSGQWSELGGQDALSANQSIFSTCSDSLSNIYSAGDFTNSFGNRYVAKWDGLNWSELGGQNNLKANNSIYSICSDLRGKVYAAGSFTNDSGFFYVAQ